MIFSIVTAFSQSITVDTNTYTVPQLVNNILINSPCINASNITWRTGTNFGSSNGIGYFQNTNTNFPMQSGVILSTGDVTHAVGPNTSLLNDGNNAWTGDTSLEATLAAAGIPMTSANATVLEFEFVPMSPYFDFDFLFASEEYGNFQCQFSDAFAFLLTNLSTGVTTNLAVVPSTNTPISVVTIRDFLYNSTCPSVNQQYFGTYNGGSNAASSATNFNGQTVVMNASSTLTPGVTYKIKLVIADRSDYQSDSAIFLSSNSFNIGQDVLTQDYTIATNTAICDGQTQLLDTGLSPATYSFIWKKNGVVIPGQTSPSLTVSQTGTYEVTYSNILFPCQTVTDSAFVEFYPPIVSVNPKDLYKCSSGASPYVFDLSKNTTRINLGINPPFVISYHLSLNDANNNINPLPLSYPSAGNQTVYIRIKNPNNDCYIVKSFQLLLAATPVSTEPADYALCTTDNTNPVATFDLNSLNAEVLNGQSISIYNVTYFASLSDLNAGTNQLPSNYSTTNTTIYIKVKVADDPSCYSTTVVNLIVNPIAEVDTLEDVITCTEYILPVLTHGNYFTGSGGTGTPLFAGDVITETQVIYIYNITTTIPSCPNESNFKVTIIKPENLDITAGTFCNSYVLPSLEFGEYHTAPAGGGDIIPGGTVLTTSQTVYFYYQEINPPFCVIDLSYEIVIEQMQNVVNLPNGFDCNSFILQPLSYGNYFDGPNGTGNQIPAGTAINVSKTIYIFAQNGTCTSESSFEVIIGINFPTSVSECAGYTLPNLIVGNYFTEPMGAGTQIPAGTFINTTQTIYVYAVTQNLPNCTDNYNFTVTVVLPVINPPAVTTSCDNYTLPTIPIGEYYTETNGGGTHLFPGDELTSSQTVYIYLNDGMGCQNEISFNVEVNLRPVIDSRSDIDSCHNYVLTNLANGNYYTGPNGTGTMMHGGDVLTTSQTIYIYAEENGCSSETSFELTIFTINAFQAQDVTICDSYTLPTLPGNNKYYTQPNGQYGTGVEIPAGTAITSTQTVYIFIESGERINCTNESSFNVTIIPTPIIAPIANVHTCESYTLPALSVGNYYTQPNKGGTILNAGDVINSDVTLYAYAETGTTPNCFDEKSFTISIFNVDQLQDVTICEGYTLPTLTHGNYYNGPNGTGGMIPQGSTVSTSKTIYIFANSGYNPNCSDETSFVATIIDTPVANPVPIANRTSCDEDGTNDGIFNFDLTTLNAIILGTQSGSEFTIDYFENFNDANANMNAVTNTILTTVYVRVGNTLAPNCYDIKPLTLIINKIPEPTPQDGIVCINSTTGELLNPFTIVSGLSAVSHTFQWFNDQGQVVGTNSTYQTETAGTFSLIATSIATGCPSEEVFVTVNPSEPAIVAYSISEDFSSNQSLTISATGTGGDYEYQIDDQPFQDSPTFDNVNSGFHTITVRDKNGCGITTTEAIVINYPKYFTPNGDGFNDTWNIVDLKDQLNSTIFIYDRFGKILKQIKPSGHGWDGTYNGKEMISDDYWFTITYTKNLENKEFKAHFALKR